MSIVAHVLAINLSQCLQLPEFIRGFLEIWFGKRTTNIGRIITEIGYHTCIRYDEQDQRWLASSSCTIQMPTVVIWAELMEGTLDNN